MESSNEDHLRSEANVLSDMTKTEYVNVAHTAINSETNLHNYESKHVSNFEALEKTSDLPPPKIMTAFEKANRTIRERNKKRNPAITKNLRSSRRLATKLKQKHTDQKDITVRKHSKTPQIKLEPDNSGKIIDNSEDKHSSKDNEFQQSKQAMSLSSQKVFRCAICNKSYEIQGCLVRHMIIHSEAGDKKYEYGCVKCAATFARKKQLAKHIAAHNRQNDGDHKCTKCNRQYVFEKDLKRHVAHAHGEKKYRCEICERSFSFLCLMQRHTCVAAYVCKVCNKSFAKSQGLEKHKAIHAGIRQICATCGKTFSDDSGLRRHMFLHSDSVFPCKFCKKTFKMPYALNTHMALHSQEKRNVCHICGEAFAQPARLRLHIMKHTGLKPYKCETCGKAFPTSSRRKKHQFVHEPEKLHRCQFCKNVFWREDNFRKHMLIHTDRNNTDQVETTH